MKSGSIQPDIEVSIVMPCLNEAETLSNCIQKAQNFLSRYQIVGEIVIGDNGSTDRSAEIAKRLGARLISVPIRGYGSACLQASKAANGRYIILADSDDSYDLGNLMPFLEKLRSGTGLVVGNRFTGEIKKGAMPWMNRKIGNPILSAIGKLLFSAAVGDFHCGLRGYSKAAFEIMELRSTGMEFSSEMIAKAHLHGIPTDEVPTILSPDGRTRRSHLRPWRDGLRHLKLMMSLIIFFRFQQLGIKNVISNTARSPF